MQWKIPFSEYFQNERSKISRISEEYTPKAVEVIVSQKEANNELSSEQMAVISRFPAFYDSTDVKWSKLEELSNQWTDKSQIWPIAHNIKLIAAANGLSAAYFCHSFRRAFKLADGKTALLNNYVPALALPLFFGSILHYQFVTLPIATGGEKCQMCTGMRAGLIQSFTSCLYPLIYSSISSIYFANYFMTYATPETITDTDSRKYFYKMLSKAVKRHRIGFISFAIFNFLFAYYLTEREQKCIDFMYFSLLRQEYIKTKKID